MCSLISEKYTPKHIKDIMGNSQQISIIKKWLNEYSVNKIKSLENVPKRRKNAIKIEDLTEDEDTLQIPTNKSEKNNTPRSCLIVIGDHGTGKTCTINSILNDLKYEIKTLNLSKLGTTKNIDDNVDKITRENTIFGLLTGEKNDNKVLVIDEIESANSPIEKKFILTLLKKNEEKWKFPIIFISNGKHSKFITALKKNTTVVNFHQPSERHMMNLLIKISSEEHMHFDSQDVATKMIRSCQNDFRRLISTLQDFKYEFDECSISVENVDLYTKMTKEKDLDINIYRATASMITKYDGIDECLKLYEGEKVIIPLVMHQNYIKCITQYHKQGNKAYDLACELSNSMATGDLIENYIYSDQNWDMLSVHGFLSCVSPAFKLCNEKMNIGNVEYFIKSLNFPMDLNRTSIRKINRKNVVNSNNCLKNFDIKDFIFLNKLLRQLLDEGKVSECADLLEGYSLTVENIESILKIDKINETKSTLSSQVKKQLTKMLKKKHEKYI